MDVGRIHSYLSADTGDFERKIGAAEKRFSDSATRIDGLAKKVALSVTGVFAGIKLGSFAKDSTLLAARYQTLGIVMERVGANAGYSAVEMGAFEQGLRKTGIAMVQSRENLTKLVAAQIDLARATEIARVAQDAAVIAGTNSSEAFGRLVDGIQSGNIQILRNLGLNANFQQAYQRTARELGKNVNALTEQERVLARTNAVMQAAAGIAGTYEDSLTTAGKQLGSMTRLIDNARTRLGQFGLDAFTKTVFGASEGIEALSSRLMELEDSDIERWSTRVSAALRGTAEAGLLVAGVVGTRMVGAYAAKTVAAHKAALAARAAAHQTLQGALAEVQMTRAMATTTAGIAAKKRALAGLTVAHKAYTAAVAQASLATRAFGGALAFVGGPIGAAVLALGGLAVAYRSVANAADDARTAQQDAAAKEQAQTLTRSLGVLSKDQAFTQLGVFRQQEQAIRQSMGGLEEAVRNARAEYQALSRDQDDSTASVMGAAAALADAEKRQEQARTTLAALGVAIADTEKRYIALATAVGKEDTASGLRGVGGLARTEEMYRRLVEARNDAQKELANLQFQRAFEHDGERAEKLAEAIADVTRKLAAYNAEMARYEPGQFAKMGVLAPVQRYDPGLAPRDLSRDPRESLRQPAQALTARGGDPMSRQLAQEFERAQQFLRDWVDGGLSLANATDEMRQRFHAAAAAVSEYQEEQKRSTDAMQQAGVDVAGVFGVVDAAAYALGGRLTGLSNATGNLVRSITEQAGALSIASAAITAGSALLQAVRGDGESARVRRENTAALERLTAGVAKLGAALSGTAGSDFTDLRAAASAAVQQAMRYSPQFRNAAAQTYFAVELRKLGMTMAEAQAIAHGFGIELNGSLDSFQRFSQALSAVKIGDLLSDFGASLKLLNMEFQLFDVSDPAEQLQRTLDLFVASMGGQGSNLSVGGAWAKILGDIDVTTSEGLEKLKQRIQEMFLSLPEMSLGDLGDMNLDQVLDLLTQMKRLADEASKASDSLNEMTASLRNVPITFNAALARYSVASGGGSATGPIPHGPRPGKDIGVVNNTYNVSLPVREGDNPARVWQNFRKAVHYGQRTGDPLAGGIIDTAGVL